jgi:enterochelin esterase-like enzyme
MKKRRIRLRTLLLSAVQIAIGAALLYQIAYWRIGGDIPQLPTRAAAASVAQAQRAQGTLPPTFTPDGQSTPLPALPTYFATPAATATLPSSGGIPIAAPPATPSPTPFVAPSYLRRTVQVHLLESPPQTTDCGPEGYVFQSRFPTGINGRDQFYHAYLPPCYGQDGRVYPVLYLMHGSGHTDNQWVQLGIAQHMDEGIAAGRYPPFIIIMPYAGAYNDATSGGDRSVEGVTINSLLPFVEANFCTWNDARGRSIGGISRGGYWALMMAFRHSELFTAVSGHSSHLRLQTDPPEFNPLATYAQADLSNMRIWMDWGEYDFLRPGQKKLHELLMNAGIPHEVTINPGGHAQYYWYEHVQEYLDWHAVSWPMARELYPPCAQSQASG